MRSLVMGFVLLALIPVSHGACWLAGVKQGATHCQDRIDKTWHVVGSSWVNSKCDDCSCSTDYLSCCNGWPTGTTKDCIIKYDYKTCTYKLINVKVKDGPCGAVGK